MNEVPATYINAALSSLGITCRAIDVSSHDPMTFGNFVATADTSMGQLHIAYDRGFYVEFQQQPAASIVRQIVAALDRQKAAANA